MEKKPKDENRKIRTEQAFVVLPFFY